MDNPTTLLVAIMYVTIVSIGLGNLLGTIAEVLRRRLRLDGVQLSWLALLPLAYFVLFWQTTEILAVEDWRFLGFIGLMTGPVLMLFASTVAASLPEQEDVRAHYFEFCPRMFLLLALFSAWMVGLDLVFGELQPPSYAAGLLCLVCVGLMITRGYRQHQVGAGLAWVLLFAALGTF